MHVAIIIDGNRRWAVKNKLPKLLGHAKGAETLKSLIKSAKDLDIQTLTLYALSIENLGRSEEELDSLFELFRKYLDEISREMKDVRIRFVGELYLLPKDIQETMNEIMEKTYQHSRTINFCVAYGGREEIIQAARKGDIAKHLYIEESPDLVIRTGGDIRTSNFMPWQTVYSEWFFVDKYWPAFTIDDLKEILEEFSKRDRNFGK